MRNDFVTSEIILEAVCVNSGDLDRFNSLKSLELSFVETQKQLNENVFTPKVGSTLSQLKLHEVRTLPSRITLNVLTPGVE